MTYNPTHSQPLVSVIVPVYNAADFLHRTYKQLKGQTYANTEILLIDDGSTDDSLQICRLLEANDPSHTKVLCHPNNGASYTRNCGIEEAKGDYIMFMDADDCIHPQAISALLAIAERHHSDIAIGEVQVTSNDSPLVWEDIDTDSSSPVSASEAYQKLASYQWWGPYAKLYRSSFLKKFRFPIPTLNEDYALMVRLFHEAQEMRSLPVPVYAYIKREGSLSTSPFSSKSTDEVDNTLSAWEYAKGQGLPFASYALRFFTESLVKVGGMAANAGGDLALEAWKKTHLLARRHIRAILTAPFTPFPLKVFAASLAGSRASHQLMMRFYATARINVTQK